MAVDGQVEEQHSEVALPAIPIAAYDPGTDPLVVRPMDPDYAGGATIDGLARREGNLLVNTGLSLENGLLFVNGNLLVNGGVSGRGAIICSGDVTINGGSSLSTSNMAAVVAHGKVILTAASSGNVFRGLVYTETGMEASNLKLIGAFIHRSVSGTGVMQLTNCDVTYDPEAVKFEWEIPGFGSSGRDAGGGAKLDDDQTAEDFLRNGHFDQALVNSDNVPFIFRGQKFSSPEKAAEAARASRLPLPLRKDFSGNSGSRYASWEEFFQKDQDRYRAMLSVMDDQYQATKSESLRRGKFSLELNQFLNTTDSMRVVFWRDLN